MMLATCHSSFSFARACASAARRSAYCSSRATLSTSSRPVHAVLASGSCLADQQGDRGGADAEPADDPQAAIEHIALLRLERVDDPLGLGLRAGQLVPDRLQPAPERRRRCSAAASGPRGWRCRRAGPGFQGCRRRPPRGSGHGCARPRPAPQRSRPARRRRRSGRRARRARRHRAGRRAPTHGCLSGAW